MTTLGVALVLLVRIVDIITVSVVDVVLVIEVEAILGNVIVTIQASVFVVRGAVMRVTIFVVVVPYYINFYDL